MNELRTDTCEQEARPASPSMTVEQLRPDTGPLAHRASKVRNPRRYEDFLVPPGDSIPRSPQRSESGGSAPPDGSTWLVAGLNGLNRQLRISSSKPVELGHDERDGRRKKKKKKVQGDGQRWRNPLSGYILLCTSICCSAMAGSSTWTAGKEERSLFLLCRGITWYKPCLNDG